MDDIILITTNDASTIMFYVGLTVIIFAGAIVLMVFLFGLSMRETLRNSKGVLGLIALSAMAPLLASTHILPERPAVKADNSIKIQNTESIETSEGLILISFTTSEPAIAYIEHIFDNGEKLPILPTYTLEKRTEHSFIVEKDKLEGGTNNLVAGNSVFNLSLIGK